MGEKEPQPGMPEADWHALEAKALRDASRDARAEGEEAKAEELAEQARAARLQAVRDRLKEIRGY